MKEKGRFLKKYRGNECLNCGVPLDLIDKYCHHCGQINTTKKLSIRDFFDEFFASIFSYDSRLSRTIIALLFSPGKISKDYIQGKRIQYANPFRFYLSVSIIFFLITGMVTDFNNVKANKNTSKGIVHFDFDTDKNTDLKKLDVDELRKYTDSVIKASTKNDHLNKYTDSINASVDSIITSAQENEILTKKAETYQDLYYPEKNLDTASFFNNLELRFDLYKKFNEKTDIINANYALDSLKHKKTRYHRWIYDKAVQSADMNNSIADVVSFFIAKLPFIIFFMLPIFALAIWLLYIRRSFSYMEHLVFLFHTQTMFFVLLIFGVLLDTIFMKEKDQDVFSTLSILVFLFYLYKSMRKFYNQRRLKTLVKFLILNQIFIILATIGLTIGFLASFVLY